MARKRLAKSTKELDQRFDDGEDIHDLIDMSKARVIRRPGSSDMARRSVLHLILLKN
jgi:hypothetical protein